MTDSKLNIDVDNPESLVTFKFYSDRRVPVSKNIRMVTGEVARVSDEGVGVVFKVIFRK